MMLVGYEMNILFEFPGGVGYEKIVVPSRRFTAINAMHVVLRILMISDKERDETRSGRGNI